MNTSLFVLILIPFLLCVLFILGTIVGIIKHGPRWDILITLGILGAIGSYLGLMLSKSVSKKGSLLEYPGSEKVSFQARKMQTRVVLFTIYLILGGLALIVFDTTIKKQWVGLGFILFGLGMWYLGISGLSSDRKSQISLSKEDRQELLVGIEKLYEPHRKWDSYMIALVIVIGGVSILMYRWTSLNELVSRFDLVGFLVFLSGYGAWFALRGIALKKKLKGLRQIDM